MVCSEYQSLSAFSHKLSNLSLVTASYFSLILSLKITLIQSKDITMCDLLCLENPIGVTQHILGLVLQEQKLPVHCKVSAIIDPFSQGLELGSKSQELTLSKSYSLRAKLNPVWFSG